MRVVIAEDAAVLREGLARLLTDRGHEVCAAVADAVSRPRPRRAPLPQGMITPSPCAAGGDAQLT